jgi:hypothetical protein
MQTVMVDDILLSEAIKLTGLAKQQVIDISLKLLIDNVQKKRWQLPKEEINDQHFFTLFGALETEESAEALIENIKQSRTFLRKVESF